LKGQDNFQVLGCPDWRDSSAYAKRADDLEDWQWKWAFLRRYDFYRELWNEAEETDHPDFRAPPTEEGRRVILRVYGLIDLPWYGIADLVASPFEEPIFGKPIDMLPYSYYEEHQASKWFTPRHYAEHVASRLFLPTKREDGRWAGYGTCIMLFSFAGRIDEQIAHAKAELEKLEEELALTDQHRNPKLHGEARGLWPIYLRLLDAVEQGARPMEIFRHFEAEGMSEIQEAANEASKIRGWIEAAQEVQKKVIFCL